MSAQKFFDDWNAARERVLTQPAEAAAWLKKANGVGEYGLAIEIAEHFLTGDAPQGDEETQLLLRQRYAVALYRAGFTEKAKVVLEGLQAAGARDSETLGLSGSLYKILSGQAPNADEKKRLLGISRDLYRRGFDPKHDYYCGINAATLSILLDETETGKALATATLQSLPQQEDSWNAWEVATAAEAKLILDDVSKATELYQRSVTVSEGRWADITATRRQCRLLCEKTMGNPALLDACFPKNNVGLFAGHMIDAVGRPKPRFPADAVAGVEQRIEDWLKKNNIRFAYSSAACGGDILFQEVAHKLGLETHIVLPFAEKYFEETSVVTGGAEWVPRFKQILADATSVTVINKDVPDYHPSAYDFANQMIGARAAQRAVASDGKLSALVVWNGQVGDAPGGTAYAVDYWSKGKIPIWVIDPLDTEQDRKYSQAEPPAQEPFPAIFTASPTGVQTAVAALLMLRFKGYETMREKDFQHFYQKMLASMALTLAQKGWFPARYGFGSHYLFVWDNLKYSAVLNSTAFVREAGQAAGEFMALLSAHAAADGAQLEHSLCLDVAPVQIMVNPLLNQYAHEGIALSKLAVLTRTIPAGTIYATEAFASLAAFEKIRDFRCTYFGSTGGNDPSTRTRLYNLVK